jgi:hypothetical protein
VLPEKTFTQFIAFTWVRLGGQHKFPRVLKGKMLEDWKKFLKGELIKA